MNTRSTWIALLGALAAAAPAHAATPLPANGTVSLSDMGTISAVVDKSMLSTPNLAFFSIGSAVLAPAASNSLGGLTFVYQVNNFIDDPTTIVSSLLSGFSGYSIDVGYADALSSSALTPFVTGTKRDPLVAPTTASASSTGNDVTFNFNDKTFQSTELLVIETNATAYTTTTDSVDPDLSKAVSTFTAYAPAPSGLTPNSPNPAPEPSAATLFVFVGAGLLGLAARARLRRGAPALAA